MTDAQKLLHGMALAYNETAPRMLHITHIHSVEINYLAEPSLMWVQFEGRKTPSCLKLFRETVQGLAARGAELIGETDGSGI